MRSGDPHRSRQLKHIAVHTCVDHASPVDHLCLDFVTAYITSARGACAQLLHPPSNTFVNDSVTVRIV